MVTSGEILERARAFPDVQIAMKTRQAAKRCWIEAEAAMKTAQAAFDDVCDAVGSTHADAHSSALALLKAQSLAENARHAEVLARIAEYTALVHAQAVVRSEGQQ